jgi:RIO kinase 1
VENVTNYFGRFAPELLSTNYGKEIWKMYANGTITPTTVLTGFYDQVESVADVKGVMQEINYERISHERALARKSQVS